MPLPSQVFQLNVLPPNALAQLLLVSSRLARARDDVCAHATRAANQIEEWSAKALRNDQAVTLEAQLHTCEDERDKARREASKVARDLDAAQKDTAALRARLRRTQVKDMARRLHMARDNIRLAAVADELSTNLAACQAKLGRATARLDRFGLAGGDGADEDVAPSSPRSPRRRGGRSSSASPEPLSPADRRRSTVRTQRSESPSASPVRSPASPTGRRRRRRESRSPDARRGWAADEATAESAGGLGPSSRLEDEVPVYTQSEVTELALAHAEQTDLLTASYKRQLRSLERRLADATHGRDPTAIGQPVNPLSAAGETEAHALQGHRKLFMSQALWNARRDLIHVERRREVAALLHGGADAAARLPLSIHDTGGVGTHEKDDDPGLPKKRPPKEAPQGDGAARAASRRGRSPSAQAPREESRRSTAAPAAEGRVPTPPDVFPGPVPAGGTSSHLSPGLPDDGAMWPGTSSPGRGRLQPSFGAIRGSRPPPLQSPGREAEGGAA